MKIMMTTHFYSTQIFLPVRPIDGEDKWRPEALLAPLMADGGAFDCRGLLIGQDPANQMTIMITTHFYSTQLFLPIDGEDKWRLEASWRPGGGRVEVQKAGGGWMEVQGHVEV